MFCIIYFNQTEGEKKYIGEADINIPAHSAQQHKYQLRLMHLWFITSMVYSI